MSGIWRVTFGKDSADAVDVDLEDYVGRASNLRFAGDDPGELLREDVLPALGRSPAEIARRLGVSRQTLHAILAEKAPVTSDMALRIGKPCGSGPEL